MTKDSSTIYLSDCTPEGANRVDDATERARADCERPRGVRQQATMLLVRRARERRATRNEYKRRGEGNGRLQLHCLHLRVCVHARGVEKCQIDSASP